MTTQIVMNGRVSLEPGYEQSFGHDVGCRLHERRPDYRPVQGGLLFELRSTARRELGVSNSGLRRKWHTSFCSW